ncbi:MAG: signal peptidase II [Bacteroidales bacterium]|uniref:signal peptidase II n=1 Tax=Candidatus Cryptobacteroides sp. TaxID=2952915 RepID=UPI002A76328B|nr:signal peptidase II [Candidatus Cryptobacteroides sp.]MDD7135756.1 signal peptidase II [Bacteroidales bacterium]MDD7234897.1 signal peptidase II [Bacteroidales bacterium]MDY2702221.1 signal peptidase II [Candidatus Cryptobacteroides sp.]
MKVSKGTKLFALGVLLVVIDQIMKILVKTNMQIGEHFNVIGNWFQIFFIENEGMAFGMKFGGMAGKFCLSLFRIILFGLLFWWISSLSRKSVTPDGGKALLPDGKTPVVPTGVLVGLTLIAAGAMGNLIDCLFYGLIFDYAPFMFGRVVDMLYFPLIDTVWPTWMPFVGGERFLFFAPIFNFADSCVTVGAIYLLIFQYSFFMREDAPRTKDKNAAAE